MEEFGTALKLYFGGDMEASLALGGQVMGRIDAVKPVAQILEETMAEFYEVAARLGSLASLGAASV
jgi:enoyl-[acyl-carrier protein] reductase II